MFVNVDVRALHSFSCLTPSVIASVVNGHVQARRDGWVNLLPFMCHTHVHSSAPFHYNLAERPPPFEPPSHVRSWFNHQYFSWEGRGVGWAGWGSAKGGLGGGSRGRSQRIGWEWLVLPTLPPSLNTRLSPPQRFSQLWPSGAPFGRMFQRRKLVSLGAFALRGAPRMLNGRIPEVFARLATMGART